jgi:phospholipase C
MTVLSRLLMLVLLGGMFVVAPTVAASAAVTSPAAVAAPAAAAPYQGTLTTPAASVPVGTSITFSYSVPSAGVTSTNWVGIYQAGQTPGDVGSTTYQYTPDASGTVTFATTSLTPGSYVAYYLYDNGYDVLAGPVGFTVTGASPYAGGTLTSTVTSVPNAQSITFSYSVPTAGVTSTNWVGIYEPGQTPGTDASTTYQYTPDASGTVTFSTSALDGVGNYVAYFFYDNGYQVIAGPVSFSVTPGTLAPAPVYQRAIGAHQLAGPLGVATATNGDIWATDTGRNRVTEFDASGRPLRTIGAGLGLNQPEGIALGPAGSVWVADTGNDRIVELSPAGRLLTSFGGKGSGNAQLDQPVALALSPTAGTVYVADQDNNRIEEFTAAGGYAGSISVPTPAGVALDRAGDIWVSSPSYASGNQVYEFSPTGAQLLSFGSTQASYGALGNTGGIAIGPDGKVYVAQSDYNVISVFGPDGTFETEFGLQSNTADATENLAAPEGLAVTASGDVLVADTGNDRLVEFFPASGSAAGALVPLAAAPRGPALPLIIGLSLAALLLAAGGAWGFLAYRRRPARSAQAAAFATPAGPDPTAATASHDVASHTAAAVSCEMPDPATQEPFAAVQQRIGGQERPLKRLADVDVSRRKLLVSATALSGLAVGGAALPANLRKMMAATPRDLRGRLSDIEHIVILMQENRSFDHYFGTMPGVRGFQDPTAITLPGGKSVFYQPDPTHADGYLTPFHYDTKSTSAQQTPGTDHSWGTQHQAWDNGAMDQWVAAKGEYTMGYFTQPDIPFHWALAQAFTVCDSYHCSVLGPTNPNRLYMWSGMLDPNGTGGGPVTDDSPAFNNAYLSWTTYPERLEAAGVSWQVYQEEDNYDDNALAWFKQFSNAPTSSPLWQRGMRKRPAGWFEADARAGRLPQVSWLVAPTAQTEHPDYYPAAGAEYIAGKVDAIAANEDLWRSTLFILCYDENDGMFDHVPPPIPPAGTTNEFVDGLPIGLGFRVPAIVVSPWSVGGYVCSDVLDHTSLIRLIEARFGVTEPNISAWRRANCGDFTTALRLPGGPARWPSQNQAVTLAAAGASFLTAQQEVFDNPAPTIPAVNEPIPEQ